MWDNVLHIWLTCRHTSTGSSMTQLHTGHRRSMRDTTLEEGVKKRSKYRWYVQHRCGPTTELICSTIECVHQELLFCFFAPPPPPQYEPQSADKWCNSFRSDVTKWKIPTNSCQMYHMLLAFFSEIAGIACATKFGRVHQTRLFPHCLLNSPAKAVGVCCSCRKPFPASQNKSCSFFPYELETGHWLMGLLECVLLYWLYQLATLEGP